MRTADTNVFERETHCVYRGEEYIARDNGAVLRRSREGKRKRQLDDTWTFGTPSASTGYMGISEHTVHRIVATAFHGPQPSASHIVDHIDTNRRNNRPENLRWVTRLENILLNPITAKRVIYHWGSIENFLADPNKVQRGVLTPDFEWMRTVTRSEAEYSRDRLLALTHSDKPSTGRPLGEWVFGVQLNSERAEANPIVESKTLGAVQRNWRVPAEFPLCPSPNRSMPLENYSIRLDEGTVFAISPFGQSRVARAALAVDGNALFVLSEQGREAVKPWALPKVTFEDDRYVHESRGTFFSREGAEKRFAVIQGLPWEGGDSIDDYC